MNQTKIKRTWYPGAAGNCCQWQGTFTALELFILYLGMGGIFKRFIFWQFLHFFQSIKSSSDLLSPTHGFLPDTWVIVINYFHIWFAFCFLLQVTVNVSCLLSWNKKKKDLKTLRTNTCKEEDRKKKSLYIFSIRVLWKSLSPQCNCC